MGRPPLAGGRLIVITLCLAVVLGIVVVSQVGEQVAREADLSSRTIG